MSDFDILIGVDLTTAESQIETLLASIYTKYPMNLQATIGNEKELKDSIINLVKLLSKFDADLGLNDDLKDLKEAKSLINDLQKQLADLKKADTSVGDGIAEGAKEAKKEIDNASKSVDKMLIKQKNSKGRVTDTERTGNKFLNDTTVTTQGKGQTTENVRNIDAFDNYVSKVKKNLGEIPEEIQKNFSQMRSMLVNGDYGFNDTKKQTDALVDRALDKKKALELQEQEIVKWEKISNDVQREGLANYASIGKLSRMVTELTNNEANSLKEVQKQLKAIEAQYTKINAQRADTKFSRNVADKGDKIKKTSKANLDTTLLGSDDLSKMQDAIDRVYKADTETKLTNSVKAANHLYDELLSKQKQILIQKQLEAKNDKERLAIQQRLGELTAAQADQQHQKALEEWQIKQNVDKVDGKSGQASQLKDQLTRDGLIDPQAFNEAENKLQEIRQLAKTSLNGEDIDKGLKEVDKILGNIQADYDKLSERQQRLNTNTHEWNKEIDQIKNGGFVDPNDFTAVSEMIKGVTVDSDNFEKQLKAVENRINRLNALAQKRQNRQSDIDVKKMQNNNKVDDMSQRNIVPQSMLDDFRAMNNMLDFSSSKQDIAQIARELQILSQLEEDIKKAGKEELKIRNLIEQAQKDLTKSTDKYKDSLESIVHNSERQIKGEQALEEIKQRAAQIEREINQLKDRGTQLTYDEARAIQLQILELERLAQSHRDVEKAQANRDSTLKRVQDQFASNEYRSTRGINVHSNEYKQITEMNDAIREKVKGLANMVGHEFDQAVKEIEQAMNELNVKSRDLRDKDKKYNSSTLGQLSNAIQKVPIWASAMTLIYGTMNQIVLGFQGLLEVDKAMTNLAKVSEASGQQLNDFKTTAIQVGKGLGVVASEVINATASFQKLGFSLNQATMLGKNSILYANVGDMSVEAATENIISTVKGFNVEIDREGSNITKIVDIFNEVGNNFAISSEGIGEALKRSSAVLNQAGNTIEQSVALVTAANTTIQDPNAVGTALKTVSMRLRGVNEEGKIAAELIPTIQHEFDRINKSMGKTSENGLNLLEKDGKTFKSTYDIMAQIAEVWGQLSNIEQANLVEVVGGKHQGSIVAAMIQNWSDATGSYETALNSAGSGMREFNTYMESFQYKIGVAKNSMQEFWIAFVNTDAVKNMIDLFSNLLQVVTKLIKTFGSMALVTPMLGTMALFLNKGLRDVVLLGKLGGKSVKLFEGLTTVMGTFLKVGMRLFGWTTALMLLGEAISFVWDIFSAPFKVKEKRSEALQEEIDQLTQLQDKYKSMDKEFKSSQSGLTGLDYYARLEGTGSKRTLQEQQDYIKMQDYIKAEMPELISHYNDYGDAVLYSAEQMKRLREETEKKLLVDQRDQLNTKIDDADFGEFEKQQKKIQDLQNSVNLGQTSTGIVDWATQYLNSQMDGMDRSSEQWTEKLAKLREKIFQEFNKMTPDERTKAQPDIDMFNLLLNRYGSEEDMTKALQEFRGKIKQRTEQTNKILQDAQKNISPEIAHFKSLLDDQFTQTLAERGVKANSNEGIFANQLKDMMVKDVEKFHDTLPNVVKKVPEYIDEAMSILQKNKINIDDLVSTDPTKAEDMAKQIGLIIQAIMDAMKNQSGDAQIQSQVIIDALEAMRQKQIQVATGFANQPMNPVTFIGDALPLVQSFISEIGGLDSAYRQLSDGQQLSLTQVMQLVGQYPQLTKHLKMHNGVLSLEKDALMDLAKIKEKEFIQDMKMKKDEAINAKNKADKVIGDILREAKALDYLATIKSKGVNAALAENSQKIISATINGDRNARGTAMNERVLLEELKDKLQAQEASKEEIANIEKLLNQDWSSQLGKLSSGSSKSSKELQDAYYVADAYAKKISELNVAIAKQQDIQKDNVKWSGTYQNALKEEIRLTKEKKSAIDAQVTSLQKQVADKIVKKTGMVTISKDNNKTARAKQAEIQQEIDQAIEKINQLKQESLSTGDSISNLNKLLIDAHGALFEYQRQTLTDDIAFQDYAMNLYDDTSANYRKHALEKENLIKEQLKLHQQELDYYEKEKKTNKDLTKSQLADLDELIRQKRISVYETRQAVTDLENIIDSSTLNEQLAIIADEGKKYADKISDIQDKIKYDIDQDKTKDTPQYIKYLQEIAGLHKGELEDVKNNIKQLEETKKKYANNKEMLQKINDEIEKQKDKLRDVQTSVKDVGDEIKTAYESLADHIVELYKNQLELQKQAEDDAYQSLMDAEQKRHKQKMDNIDQEMRILKDAFDQQMQMIDREEAARNYGTDVGKMTDETKKLKEQIAALSLDDSYEAKAKKAELVKQLAEKETELANKQHDREVELRKDSLQDDYDAENEKLQLKKDGYDEDLQRFTDTEEKKKKEREKYWEQQLNDEKKFAEIRKQVLDGNFESLLTSLSTWSDNVSIEMGTLGSTITENFTNKVKEAILALTQLKGMGSYTDVINNAPTTNVDGSAPEHNGIPTGSGDLSNPTPTTGTPSTPTTQPKPPTTAPKPTPKPPTPSPRYYTVAKGDNLWDIAEKYYRDGTKWTKIRDANHLKSTTLQIGKKLLIPFKTGGYTGDWSGNNGRLAVLHKKELVLNDKQTEHILSTAKVLEKLKGLVPNLSALSAIAKVPNKDEGEKIVQEIYNVTLEIANMNGTKKDVDNVADQFVKTIKRTKGGRF